MLVANGVSRTKEQWAQVLGVSRCAVEHSMSQGLTMQDVVDLYSGSFTGPCTPPEERRNPLAPVQGTPPGPLLQSPSGAYSFRSLCPDCAEAARRYYDRRHHDHKMQLEHERELNDAMFTYVNPAAYESGSTNPQQGSA